MTKNFLLLSALGLLVMPISAMADELGTTTTAVGEELVEATNDMATEATAEFVEEVDCADAAMGEEMVDGVAVATDCVSKPDQIEENAAPVEKQPEPDTMIHELDE